MLKILARYRTIALLTLLQFVELIDRSKEEAAGQLVIRIKRCAAESFRELSEHLPLKL